MAASALGRSLEIFTARTNQEITAVFTSAVQKHTDALFVMGDPQGRRRDFADIPKTVMQLKDDPFRSLAGELRRAGGFAKDTTPFSEFLWADFFRRKIKRKAVEADFSAAMERALRLARSEEAEYLPGWCGPKADA
jgi:hypothetical protein